MIEFSWLLLPATMLASGIVSGVSAIYLWRRPGAVGRTGLAAVLAASSLWGLAYGLELAVATHESKELWGSAKYLGVCALPPAWLVFALQYTGREQRVTARLVALLSVVPLGVVALLAVPHTRSLVRSYPEGALDRFPIVELGPVFWMLFAYSAALVVVATGLLAVTLMHTSSAYRRQNRVLLAAIALVWIANLLTNVGVGVFQRVDPTPVALSVAGLLLIWGVFRFGLLDLVPVARTTLIETMTDAVLVLDAHHRVVDLNPAAQRLIAGPASAAIGRRADDLFGEAVLPLADAAEERGELALQEQGEVRDYEVVLSPVRAGDDTHAGHLLVLRDITQRKEAERRLEQLAHYDSVTGVPNRKLFTDRLEHALAMARRSGRPVGVLFFDLDGFKLVNDSFGHDVGDRVLIAVARRVEKCLRSEDTVARFGGDEFSVILPELTQPQDAAVVAAKILRAISAPVRIDDRDRDVTASLGIAVWPEDGPDARALLVQADAAMYASKARGRNRFQFSSPELARDTRARLELECDLRRAVDRQELFLEFQPFVELDSGSLLGFEALVRWNHPRHGLLVPAQFLPLAEETGLVVALDRWVMREACRGAQHWADAIEDELSVAVNMSPAHLVDRDLRGTVASVLDETGLDPSRLSLEVNERSVISEGEPLIHQLEALKTTGVSIALDDFGAGTTSLGQLHQLPLDVLKVDRGFVERLRPECADSLIISAIVNLAHALGLRVIAEGVERVDQLALLREVRCDIGQGFLFSRPLPLSDVITRLRRDST